ncbi:MAG: AraC family transcriptional regulator [Acidimicrobiia bacterium]
MPRTRQPGSAPAIATSSFPLPHGATFEQHSHRQHQLAWASEGVVTVTVAQRRWVLPRTRALWIPAGTPHVTAAADRSVLLGLYFAPARSRVRFRAPTVVGITELLAALLLHLAATPGGRSARARAEAVVFDLLRPVDVATLHLPMPADDRARRVADALVADVGDPRTLAEWGRAVGASERTLTRAFLTDTGMTFSAWRAQLRLGTALPLLADGRAVAATARAVGYANPSAFIAAFRRALGTSPGSYFTRPDAQREA